MPTARLLCFVLLAFAPLSVQGNRPLRAEAPDLQFGESGYADSEGVKIHYVTRGKGPLLILIHGFPDYWYSWRHQIPALSEHFRVVAMDQRGYNKSDQPQGVANYTLDKLAGDVRAVIRHFDCDKAVLVGHDWGGAVAWTFAMTWPEMTERLVILNCPHPNGLRRELATSPEQRKNSGYARVFQAAGAEKLLSPALLALRYDKESRPRYQAAFERSSIEAMLNYYRANYPREPYELPEENLPPVQCPVLMIHGLKDQALLPGSLNDTWKWIDKELTLITVPSADHFVQHDAPELVTRRMVEWLTR